MAMTTTARLIARIEEQTATLNNEMICDEERNFAAHASDENVTELCRRADAGDREAIAYLACESNHADLYFAVNDDSDDMSDYWAELKGDEARDGGL